jgi:rSAM/selenodomain-associated transferase 1
MLPFQLIEPGRDGVLAPAGACAMGVMAKVPRSGRVKTRLVPPLTHEQASALSGCFLRDVAATISAAARSGSRPIRGVAVYLPRGEEQRFEDLLPRDFLLLPQRGADLGERLFNAALDLLSAGFHSVCLVNSDSPTLPVALLLEAALALAAPGDRVVIGPASDGGYYLVGLKRAHRRLFEDVTWSSPSVLAQTLERARELSTEVHLLPEWYDVDDARSLRLLCRELFGQRNVAVAPGGRGAATRALLDEVLPQLEGFTVE